MSSVTAIERQKRRTLRYSIFLDGEYGFSLSDLELSQSGLRVGQELSPAEVMQYLQQSSAGKAYAAALRYLSYRHRTRAEMERYLQRKGYETETAVTLERLGREKLLVDAEFAGHWIADRQHLRPRSRRRLEAELRAKGLNREDVTVALATVTDEDELAAAQHLANKKRTLAGYQDPLKLQRYLAGQGFSWNTIRRVLGADD